MMSRYILLLLFYIVCSQSKYFIYNKKSRNPTSEIEYQVKYRQNGRIANFLWPNGIVYYKIIPGYKEIYIDETLKAAMKEIEDNTCIKFKANKSVPHFITISNEGQCASTVGYLTEYPMVMKLNSSVCSLGSVIHELIHVLGFWHEHTRTDSKTKIDVLWRNIKKGSEKNFDVRQTEEVQNLLLPYDFNSIMHYRPESFALPGKNTIEPKFVGARKLMGQRKGMTQLDIAKINRLYGCMEHYLADDLFPLPPITINNEHNGQVIKPEDEADGIEDLMLGLSGNDSD